MSDLWGIYDARTGRRSTVASFGSEARAWQQIAAWWQRHCEGGRPDIDFDMMAAMTVRKVDWDE